MPSSHARNVALTPELSAFVDDLVASGAYANASEVMRAGLRALKHRHALDEVSDRISIALDQLDRGEGITGEPREVLGAVLDAARARRNA
ncbi:type II toxin-antitoxin system ParD family antitoxin [uncultured Rhodospira sp.]|uniref:type II toxin-antitoxin system ParD family antitoxin n=1 Tax=uncultured Rhodospira sp. TaxID=1936189 RepID=UPI00262D1435|nr:type II toxin-antitoxin system ParD family antitoxin [uncultured Rhodospira sp.]